MAIDRQMLNEILVGKTHSIARGDEGMAHLFFKDDKTAFLKRGEEATMCGDWQPSGEGFDVAWQNGPSREWKLSLDDEALSFSLDGAGLIGVSRNWQNGDSMLLEAEFNRGAA
ncbi:MAG: hypothetical protein COC24_006245 [Alphaproteobacteria bacterium]|nr:hypothetical protein [Alphaproteobacteria bacterium]